MHISLPLFFTITTWNSVTRFMEEMLYVFLFTFFSLPLIFTLAASISPFSYRRYKLFMFFFQRNSSALVFISRSSSFSVIQTLILSRKKESAFVVVFISKSYAIYRRNARVLEMQNFIPACMTYPVPTGVFYCMSMRTKWRRPWCIVIGTK